MTKILNHINTYADLTAYDNDKDKNYPNIAYIQETNEVKWLKEKPDLVVCKYNVTSTSEETKIFNSSTGIAYQIIDDVISDTFKYTYTFDTLGEHTVKYKLDGTSIADYAFSDCTAMTSVTIPNSVTSIGIYAFENCGGLTSITIPNSVTLINDYAFYNCTALTSVTIPNSVTEIGQYAFENTPWYNNQPDGLVYAGKVAYKYKGTMPSGTSIVLKEEAKGIANNAFENCGGLTSITIPNSVTSIGNYAFSNCTGLTSVTIPNSVTEIGIFAFNNCSSLTSVTIPNSVTSISTAAFSGCSGLTSVTIPNSVTSIGADAFSNCTGLTSITIPNSVTSIGGSAFENTPWYNNQPDGLVYAGKVAYKYKGTMPSGTSIVLKEETKGIANNAFMFCSGLTSITIPNSVTEIGDYAFSYSDSLTSVTIQATTPPTLSNKNAFDDTNNCPIYVPAESVDAYKTATNWSSYASRITAIVAV